ncbi:MAG: hypothetical protein ACXVCD_14635 [Pseudobdellovibrionaceae bacterium]
MMMIFFDVALNSDDKIVGFHIIKKNLAVKMLGNGFAVVESRNCG